MKAVVDKIEEGIAELHLQDQDACIYVPVKKLPVNTKEGTWLILNFTIDETTTSVRKGRIRGLLDRLINNTNR